MKIFTAYFAHETNSFSPIPTNLSSFEELGVYRPALGDPADHPDLLKGAGHFFKEALRRGDDVFVGLSAHAQPSRPVNRADYETLRGWLLDDLAAAGDVDIVLIFMHGAMMAEGCDDCEGDVAKRIREKVGPDTPIGILLDLHCNITQDMLRNATFIKACKEYPHTDFGDRASELYELCVKTRKKAISPTVAFKRTPMLGLYQTQHQPMRGFIDSIMAHEKTAGILSVSLGHGFPWSDFPDAGASVIVVTDGDQALAEASAERISREFFDLRARGQAALCSVKDAIDEAMKHAEGSVIIADMSDNPGGGAASDSTRILEELLARNITDALVAYLWDPAAVDLAFAAGEGAQLPLRVGGKVGPASGNPIDLEARVIKLRADAKQPHIADGAPTALGRTALISASGIDIVLNDVRQQPFSPGGLIEAGVNPWSKKILVLKSSHHFYAGFSKKASKIIYCDAPGTLNSDVAKRPYKRITRPIWPLDDINPFEHPPRRAVAE